MDLPAWPTEHGVLLQVEVVPGAQQDVFPSGFNQWRGRIQARVRAPARDGQANQALCALVAEHFSVEGAAVEVTRGHTSRQKTLLLRGLEADRVLEKLQEVMGT